MLVIMKSDKVDSIAKVALRPTLSVAETDSHIGKEETACMSSCEKSTKPASGEVVGICVLLKPNGHAKFINGVRKVVCPSFAKHTTQYRMTALFAMM
ncbi:hypothetical protein ACFXTI_038221 [Malus domestica]